MKKEGVGKMETNVSNFQQWLNEAEKILLVISDGEWGSIEPYLGSHSISEMRRVLTENTHGDQFAFFDVDGRKFNLKNYLGD